MHKYYSLQPDLYQLNTGVCGTDHASRRKGILQAFHSSQVNLRQGGLVSYKTSVAVKFKDTRVLQRLSFVHPVYDFGMGHHNNNASGHQIRNCP